MRIAALLILLLFQDKPPGPHVPLQEQDLKTFTKDDRLVAAYYFYWYDVATNAHLLDGDGTDALTDHPASMKGFSFKNADWHRRELLEMTAAGIDIVLPVYWSGEDWSVAGLRKMAEALDAIRADRKRAPRVGMFYDTTTLTGADLTKEKGRDAFYVAIRDFFSLVPPRDWALIDGRPVVWLYGASFPKAFDAGAFEYVKERFKKDFAGRTPYLVAEESWKGMPVDRTYAWGAALSGPRELGVVAVGPGYDDRAVPGRKTPVRGREKGLFYERSWYIALKLQPRIIAIETWNEFHEGTDICESREHGRAYLDATAKYADKFKKGEFLMNPKGAWTGQPRVGYNLKYNPVECGLAPVECEDGLFEVVEMAGLKVLTTKENKRGDWRHLYFAVDDSYAHFEKKSYEVEVEYFDKGKGSFQIQFDAFDRSVSGTERWYKKGGEEFFADSGEWKFAKFDLTDAYFANHQNGGADLRLAIKGRGLAIRKVLVKVK